MAIFSEYYSLLLYVLLLYHYNYYYYYYYHQPISRAKATFAAIQLSATALYTTNTKFFWSQFLSHLYALPTIFLRRSFKEKFTFQGGFVSYRLCCWNAPPPKFMTNPGHQFVPFKFGLEAPRVGEWCIQPPPNGVLLLPRPFLTWVLNANIVKSTSSKYV